VRKIKQQQTKRKRTIKIASHGLFNGADLVNTMKAAIMDVAIISQSSIWSIRNDFIE